MRQLSFSIRSYVSAKILFIESDLVQQHLICTPVQCDLMFRHQMQMKYTVTWHVYSITHTDPVIQDPNADEVASAHNIQLSRVSEGRSPADHFSGARLITT